MEGRGLADLYFARWPLQENWFKAAGAVGLANHRGNCGRMVANVAIVTELERLEHRLVADRTQLATAREQTKTLTPEVAQARLAHERAQRDLQNHRAQVDQHITRGDVESSRFAKAAVQHHTSLIQEECSRRALARLDQKVSAQDTRTQKLEASISKAEARVAHIEPQRQIRKLDVALDTILTATKLTALQLIVFVLREYLVGYSMTPLTFVSRLLTTKGRLIRRESEEVIVFYENPRDPEMIGALRVAVERLNSRGLTRHGRILRYVVEPPPAHSHAPP
jgi:predicted  nucleic acid-binding Zn-ribbon protein